MDSYGEYDEFSTSPVNRREVPSPAAVLVVELAEPLLAAGAADRGAMRPVTAFLGCPGRGPVLTRHAGLQHCVEVQLSLLGAYRLFGSMRGLPGQIVPLDALWGPTAARLTERLVAAGTPEGRFDVLDRVLGRAIAEGPEPDPEVGYAWHRLGAAASDLSVADLVTETGWSRGRLAERFRAQTGLAPKAAATLFRFHRAVQMLERPDPPSLASVALLCGYYDQAHFNRDFRSFAGCSPTAWVRSRLTDLVGTGVVP